MKSTPIDTVIQRFTITKMYTAKYLILISIVKPIIRHKTDVARAGTCHSQLLKAVLY